MWGPKYEKNQEIAVVQAFHFRCFLFLSECRPRNGTVSVKIPLPVCGTDHGEHVQGFVTEVHPGVCAFRFFHPIHSPICSTTV